MKNRNDDSTWLGINSDGNLVKVSHEKLLEHVKTHFNKYNVNVGLTFVQDGVRLVRGRHPITTAINARWYDLAKRIADYYTDEQEGK